MLDSLALLELLYIIFIVIWIRLSRFVWLTITTIMSAEPEARGIKQEKRPSSLHLSFEGEVTLTADIRSRGMRTIE